MEQNCKNSYCKKKLPEYRELTRKLYDDIDSHESDLQDKDHFIHKIVKARNDYEKEVENLKRKTVHLSRRIMIL